MPPVIPDMLADYDLVVSVTGDIRRVGDQTFVKDAFVAQKAA